MRHDGPAKRARAEFHKRVDAIRSEVLLASLGRIPRKSERFTWAAWEFEVVDVDRNRVDQVLASRVSKMDVSEKQTMKADD